MSVKDYSVVTMADRLERLGAHDVAPEEFELSSRTYAVSSGKTAGEPEKPDRASVVGNGILTFVSGMSEQKQADVQHSYLFASLVANKRYPKDEQGKEWYQLFLEVMQDCGWIILQKYYDSTAASGKSFTMDELVLKVLGSALTAAAIPGPASLLMLKVASDAVASLAARDKPLRVFNQNIQESGTGGFGVAACHETPHGEVIMALGAVRFIKRTNQTQVLFVNWDSSSVDLYRGESHMTMVPTVINRTRAIIIEKLGDRAQQKIEAYEL
ncbi:hypothetical protein [Pseudomonas sp. FP198]|uniref:hypothetical protein n=1 Tax=Pseudomonas sp. FP198 TaxID=2954084 RepID=UPI002732FB7A|nr:hypothetical protein [Pseudomonas sp. FP198]WLG95251.1 hypothetical protein PSH78_23345 [Pseudomonas sp. FP198]